MVNAERLISFLGTGDYRETTYRFRSNTLRTKYVAQALALFTRPAEIHLIATDKAWNTHGSSLTDALLSSGCCRPERVSVPEGGDPDTFWKLFEAIVRLIRSNNRPVLLDITHGFRMQPFFAAACIEYIHSVLEDPPSIRVVYGEFREAGQESPIWELTPFLELLGWSRNLLMFLRTGQADQVVAATERLGRELGREWAERGRQGAQPQLRSLGRALKEFSDDFTTIRTGSLLVGNESSAQRLAEAIRRTRAEVQQHMPALAHVLDQVHAMVENLNTRGSRLSTANGQRALLALARLYQKMGRYSEAISVLREGWITLGAPSNADNPGHDDFDDDARKEQEKVWQTKTSQALTVSDVRNDIQHAGFRKQPKHQAWFERQLTSLLKEWEAAIDVMEDRSPEKQ